MESLNNKDDDAEPCVALYQNCRNVCGATVELCENTFSKCSGLPLKFIDESCKDWNANQKRVCECVQKRSVRKMRRDAIYRLNPKIFNLDPGMDEKLMYNANVDYPEFSEILVQVISRDKRGLGSREPNTEWDSEVMSNLMDKFMNLAEKNILLDGVNEEENGDIRDSLLRVADIYLSEKNKEKRREHEL